MATLHMPNATQIADARKEFVELLSLWLSLCEKADFEQFISIEGCGDGLCLFIENRQDMSNEQTTKLRSSYITRVHMVLDAHIREYVNSTNSETKSICYPFASSNHQTMHKKRKAFVQAVLDGNIAVTDEAIISECKRNGYV